MSERGHGGVGVWRHGGIKKGPHQPYFPLFLLIFCLCKKVSAIPDLTDVAEERAQNTSLSPRLASEQAPTFLLLKAKGS